MTVTRFRQGFLVFLVVALTIAFAVMLRDFLIAITLAALFAGVSHPAYLRLVRLFGGRQRLAAVSTLLILILIVVVPVLTIAGAVANEAVSLNETTLPRLKRLVDEPGEPERRMYFFLIDGPGMLRRVTDLLPLADADKDHVLERFVSVTRATLKGTVLIGAAQGALGGAAFWVLGLDSAFFWGTIMMVLSVVPGIGAALVWVPAVIVLLALGQVWQAIALALFCALVVGTVDNVLRPMLVGHDTQMHELLIFFSTLGGLLVFGGMGFVLGPILAAVFVAVWEMFGASFRTELDTQTVVP